MKKLLEYLFPPKLPELAEQDIPEIEAYHERVLRAGRNFAEHHDRIFTQPVFENLSGK